MSAIRSLIRWADEWIETFRVAPPFSARRRELIRRANEPFDPADYIEVERPTDAKGSRHE